MKYYSVLDVSPTSEDWIPNYLPVANRLVAQYGGKYLARTANHDQLEGDTVKASFRIILEWPSREAAEDFMKDPEYVPHLKARTDGSVSHHFLIQGKDEFA